MIQKFRSYLRPVRRRWGFTQRELAFLIGYKTGKSISRIEELKQRPNIDAAFACAVIFNTAPLKLFPGLLSDVEGAVLARAERLYEELQGDPSRTTRLKLDFLETLLDRLQGKRDRRYE
jgi:transcriptional regulator with XRE-family HTH domain